LLVSESQHTQALRDHVRIAVPVVMPLLVPIMNRAIAFDYETSFVTIEVCDVVSELVLSSEFKTEKASVPQKLP